MEEKKVKTSFRKTHRASAWAIKVTTAASFINRASLMLIRQILARIPPEDSWLHQDINKLAAATEFSADATLNATKFASWALSANV